MRKILFVLISSFFLSSCYTMHFQRDSSASKDFYQFSQWHHIGIWGFVEFSDPINLRKFCPKDSWESVRVRTGFLQGLVKNIPTIPLRRIKTSLIQFYEQDVSIPIPLFIGFVYSPEEVSIVCRE